MYNNVDTYMSLVPYMLYSACIHVYTCTVHCMSNSHISCVSVCVCGGGGEVVKGAMVGTFPSLNVYFAIGCFYMTCKLFNVGC